jgi:hypothetical protein
MLYPVIEAQGVMCSTLLRDDKGNVLLATFTGTQPALSAFFSVLQCSSTEGRLNGFTVEKAGQRHFSAVSVESQLVLQSKPLSMLQLAANAPYFGSLLNTHLLDAYRARFIGFAVVPEPDIALSDPSAKASLLDVVRTIWPLPFPESWKSVVMDLLTADIVQSMADTRYPPLGDISGFTVAIRKPFIDKLLAALEAGKLPQVSMQDISRLRAVQINSRFHPGDIAWTSGAKQVLKERRDWGAELIRRHCEGDWGCVSPEARRIAEYHLQTGGVLQSAYLIDATLPPDVKNLLLIRTTADRKTTIFHLPGEDGVEVYRASFAVVSAH